MGRMIEEIALSRGHEIVSIIDIDNQADFDSPAFKSADVAIEFTAPHVAYENYLKAFRHNVKVVSGSTGWMDKHGDDVRRMCAEEGQTLFWSSNFSLGVAVFRAVSRHLAQIMNRYDDYKPVMEEVHHVHKLDHPSGTAITLAEELVAQVDRLQGWVVGQLTQPDGTVPFHNSLIALEREAAFVERCRLRAFGLVARVDDGEELQRGAFPYFRGLGIRRVGVLEDGQTQRYADLRSGQSHTGGVVHDTPHEPDQGLEFVCLELSFIGQGRTAEHGVSQLDDGNKILLQHRKDQGADGGGRLRSTGFVDHGSILVAPAQPARRPAGFRRRLRPPAGMPGASSVVVQGRGVSPRSPRSTCRRSSPVRSGSGDEQGSRTCR